MGFKFGFRIRLLIGHILPVLILVPLVGMALIYLLENQLILPILANEMIDQGLLVERLTTTQAEVWTSPQAAQSLLSSIQYRQPSRIALLTPGCIMLATSRPDDQALIGTVISNLPDPQTLANPWWGITAGSQPGQKILEVVVPVTRSDGSMVGLVRIYRRITDIEQTFGYMRLLILGVLMVGLVLSGSTAVFLSESVSRPIKTLARLITNSPVEGKADLLPDFHDNEFNQLSNAFNRLQVRRYELEENRQLMLFNLIHEIGRPLGSLRAAIHALQVGAVHNPDLRTELMTGMSEIIDRMSHLLEDLALTYRGLTAQEIHLESVHLGEWFASLTPLWAESARQKQLTWETNIPEELPIIKTDPEHLAQVLDNLVSNAIKFTATPGKVSLSIHVDTGQIQFLVSDTGIGIPLEEQAQLFIPFHRVVQPGWKAPGLGLGLSIAKSITESLGGWISLSSVPGQGSTFIVTLSY